MIDVKVIELSGLLVVEVARSAAEDHISLTMSLDSLTSISISKVLSVSILDQVYRLPPLPPTSLTPDDLMLG